MNVNKWTAPEAERAATTWGRKNPPYTVDMFDFVIDGVDSWLDLGCGFGRFFDYLEYAASEPDYIGYDSSADMLALFKDQYPTYAPRVFERSITDPINNPQEGVLCSAVLIHLELKDQDKILNNVAAIKPKKFTFDINCPTEPWLDKGQDHFIRLIRGCEGAFRMTWQSHYIMTRKILGLFKDYSLSMKFYPVQGVRNKVVYFLERRSK